MDGYRMEYEAAPLEGITDAVYRRVHAKYYPGVTRYYTPFISPTMHHVFTPRERRELAPENNPGLELVPQLLGRNASDLLWAAEELASMGYREMNLNLGCPSGTVVAKRKGAGLLAYPEELDALLRVLFAAAPLRISIKTRLGMEAPSEFAALLGIFSRYPVCRLIVHARTRAEQYDGCVHRDVFAMALENTAIPLSYNGDLFTADDVMRFRESFPTVDCVMLGRGLAADPGFVTALRGGSPDIRTIREFHLELCAEYVRVFGDKNSAMHRMKAIWSYLLPRLPSGESYRKTLRKTRTWEEFLIVCSGILSQAE